MLAPDLLGHGQSAKPRADYSLGGYAKGMRDLLTVLGIDGVTVVGHSFGGGVAVQFSYQFPERTERLMLVSSGGLGPEVSPVIRAIATPGYHHAISHVVRAVVDWRGQIVTMADRAYLTDAMPVAVVWGRNDQVIPVSHAANVAALAPEARVEVIDDAGHFPHKDHPERFARSVDEFVRSSRPAIYSRARWRTLLRGGISATPPPTLTSVETA